MQLLRSAPILKTEKKLHYQDCRYELPVTESISDSSGIHLRKENNETVPNTIVARFLSTCQQELPFRDPTSAVGLEIFRIPNFYHSLDIPVTAPLSYSYYTQNYKYCHNSVNTGDIRYLSAYLGTTDDTVYQGIRRI